MAMVSQRHRTEGTSAFYSALPALAKFVNLNMRRMVELEVDLERKQNPVPTTEASGTLAGKSRMLCLEFRGETYEWVDLDDFERKFVSAHMESTMRENISHFFGIPPEKQLLLSGDGPLLCAVDYQRFFQMAEPFVKLFDLRDTGILDGSMPNVASHCQRDDVNVGGWHGEPTFPRPPRSEDECGTSAGEPGVLQVDFNGFTYDWVDLPNCDVLARMPNLEKVLHENIALYFGVPVEHQLVSDQHGILTTCADFTRVMESPCPYLYVDDCRSHDGLSPGDAFRTQAHCQTAEPIAKLGTPRRSAGAHGVQCRFLRFRDAADSYSGEATDAGTSPSTGFVSRSASNFVRSPTVCGLPGRRFAQVSLERDIVYRVFGFEIERSSDGTLLIVDSVQHFGSLARWNNEHPELALKQGDYLMSVNGISGDAEAMHRILVESQHVMIRALQQA